MLFTRFVADNCEVGPEAKSFVATSPFMVIALQAQQTVASDDPADLIKRYQGYAVPVGAVLRNARFSDVAPARLERDPAARPTHVIGEYLASDIVTLLDGKPSSNDALQAAFADWVADL